MLYCELSKYVGTCRACPQGEICMIKNNPNKKGQENAGRKWNDNRGNSDREVQKTDQVGHESSENNQKDREDLQCARGCESNGTVLSVNDAERHQTSSPGPGDAPGGTGRRIVISDPNLPIPEKSGAVTQLESYAMRLAFHKFKFDVLIMECQKKFTENGMGDELMEKMAEYHHKMKENYT